MTTTGLERPAYLLFGGTNSPRYNCVWIQATPNAYPTSDANYWTGIKNWNPRMMGLGYNGMQPDAARHSLNPGNPTSPDVGCDAFDMLDLYYPTLPVKLEPNFVDASRGASALLS